MKLFAWLDSGIAFVFSAFIKDGKSHVNKNIYVLIKRLTNINSDN